MANEQKDIYPKIKIEIADSKDSYQMLRIEPEDCLEQARIFLGNTDFPALKHFPSYAISFGYNSKRSLPSINIFITDDSYNPSNEKDQEVLLNFLREAANNLGNLFISINEGGFTDQYYTHVKIIAGKLQIEQTARGEAPGWSSKLIEKLAKIIAEQP
ncbi:MAG: hypothetical protein Q4P65_00050 [Eubacteriales bacterium]|nr:hypothetical protein [Eubacteriales bacterium]